MRRSESAGSEFQNPASGAGLLTGGCESITLPLDVAQQMISYPASMPRWRSLSRTGWGRLAERHLTGRSASS